MKGEIKMEKIYEENDKVVCILTEKDKKIIESFQPFQEKHYT